MIRMKKLTIIFLLSIIGITAFGQPVTQGSSTTITVGNARTKTFFNLILPTFTDTTSNVGGANYQNNRGIDSCGALIFTYSNNSVWVRQCSPKRWSLIGSFSGTDTIYVRFPLGVDIDSLGHQVIFIRAANGLVSGGVVSLDSCRILEVTPAIYNLNFQQYSSLVTSLTVDASDVFNRIDLVVVDTFNVASILKGTSSGIAPQPNPSSQIALAQIPIAASATCVGITAQIVFDQNLQVAGGEFDTSRSGTIAVAFANTDNPYHLTRAAFVSTYSTGSKLIFTRTGGQDTVTNGELFKFFMYLNNSAFNSGNQIQLQFLLGTTAVSTNTVINPFFNTLDTGQYQNVSMPLSAFNFSSSIFNKIVFTFAGYDTSGAGGLYLDYLQLQKGSGNVSTILTLTTNGSSGASTLINNVLNIPQYGGGSGSRFGIEDNTGVQDREVNMGAFGLALYGDNGDFIYSDNASELYAADAGGNVGKLEVSAVTNPFASVLSADVSNQLELGVTPRRAFVTRNSGSKKDIVLSVNGNLPDSTSGNVTISGVGNDSAYVNITQPNSNTLIHTRDNNGQDTAQFFVKPTNQLYPISGTSALISTFRLPTVIGGAAVFSGNQALLRPNNKSLQIETGGTGITISSWVYLDTLRAAEVIAAIDDDLSTAGSEYHLSYYEPYGSFNFQIETNTTTRFVISSIGSPAINTWYYVQGWYDQANTKVYIRVNNTIDSLDFAETTFHTTTTPFTLGADARVYSPTTNSYLRGQLKNVRFFKRPLTTAESNTLYNSGTPLPYASLPAAMLRDPYFISSWDFLDANDVGADSR